MTAFRSISAPTKSTIVNTSKVDINVMHVILQQRLFEQVAFGSEVEDPNSPDSPDSPDSLEGGEEEEEGGEESPMISERGSVSKWGILEERAAECDCVCGVVCCSGCSRCSLCSLL